MGSFSWLRADHCTKRHNISLGDSYKILIPQEFGGGYISKMKIAQYMLTLTAKRPN
jgi:hypothetical protein